MKHENDLYPPSFKAAVALAALRHEQSVEGLAARYSLPDSLIREWTHKLEHHADTVFARQPQRDKSENDFFDSRELAKIIAENSTQGFAMMDRNGYCIYANKAWLNMTGYSSEEISSQPLHYLVHHHHPDGRHYPMEECPIDRALPENFDVRAHEDIFFRKDGSTFEVTCAASPVFSAGKPVATVIEIRDVTEQKRQARHRLESEQRAMDSAKAAEEQQQRLNAFLDAAPVGIGMADANGKLILVNRANRELWGQNIHLAQDVKEYGEFKGWWADGAAHHGQPMLPEKWALARALRGESVDNDIIEIEPFDKPGTRKTISLSARPILDGQGRITGSVVAQIDITQQKQAEKAFLEEARILELLSQSGQSLAATLDLNTLLQTVTDSGRALTGAEFGAFFYNGKDESGDAYLLYTLSGASREAFERFGHPRATAVFKPTFVGEPAIRSDDITKDPRYGKMAPHHGMPKGHLPVRSYLAAPVVSRSGDVIGGLFFGHSQVAVFNERAERLITGLAAQAAMAIDNARLYDLSQRAAKERQSLLDNERMARAEAERLNQSKDEFLAMLAHELRNPLAPVSAAAAILRMAGNDANRVRQVGEIISRQIGHFTHLIDDLMDVSRVTRGLINLETEPVDIKTIINAAIEQVRPMIEARRHTLIMRIDADHAVVNGDRTRLVQVTANLLTNAAKYTPDHGEITLKVEADERSARITVSDNGNGIDKTLLPHVFDLFTQGGRGLDRTQGGLGIGLALVRAIIALHLGEVHAHSGGPGKGSSFTVSIPLIHEEGAHSQEAGWDHNESGNLSVLVVDDNVDAANSIAILLKAVGHHVKVALTAHDALDQENSEETDVFILDIGLPDMTGYDLVRALRRRPGLENKTYIALTGYGQPQDRQLSKEAGFSHHFVKPVDNQHLFKVLAEAKSITHRP